jgi:hypothetical protein
MTTTRDQQVKTVIEGLALGTLAAGVHTIEASKLHLDFSLSHAWRKWPDAQLFPRIHGHSIDDYLRHGMSKSPGRRFGYAAWEMWPMRPYLTMEAFDLDDSFDLFVSDQMPRRASWSALADLFIGHLPEDASIRD